MAHDLAASKQGKGAHEMWNRALLHQMAAQAHTQEGEADYPGILVSGILVMLCGMH